MSQDLKAISDWFGSDFADAPQNPREDRAASRAMLFAAVQLALSEIGPHEVLKTVQDAMDAAQSAPFLSKTA
ncbi:MAG: hypothetical protein RL186_1622 [Pseudomonadota bacterium]